MGLSELEELQQRYTCLEQLYNEAVIARDEAIEERDKATVFIALQLQNETEELNKQIEILQSQNKRLSEENEDLKIRLGYAKDDLNKLQQRHIRLQLEQEQCLQDKEDALAMLREFENNRVIWQGEKIKEKKKQDAEKMTDKQTDPAYSNVRDEIFTTASEKDLELEPRPPVGLKSSRPEDFFEIHEEIGKGRFGVVKKVIERSSHKKFAAKYIKLSSSGSGSSREDIMREINIMNQLHHQRLVGLMDAFDVSGKIVMIMEFVSGGELFERVADADCLTEKEASFYMYQLLQGLQYMHNKNIVHLDLKPENIVCVSKDSWDIKLIDFGLAQELVPGVKMKALKGTPEFMAPEAVNFETISLATDMWSVGVIAYILLSGLSPLLGDDDNETLANVTGVEWDFDDESFDVISDEAKDFISMLLVKNARKRNTVKQSLEHGWMKTSASANAVKIDTKKLKHFLAKRRWQKSVNALVAVRRLSSLSSPMNIKSRPSVVPSLATVPSGKEEESGDETTAENDKKEMPVQEKEQSGTQGDNGGDISLEGNKQISKQPPVFAKELSDSSVIEGETVSLEVVISNNSDCHLEWLKNGSVLTEGGRVSFTNCGDGRYSLIIQDSVEDDSGEYCCVVQNEAGRVTCKGKLSIETASKSEEEDDEEQETDSSIEVPVFTKELHDVTVSESDTVTLEVVVSGNSPFELEWFKNAVDVTESERISLVKHDSARFTLVIRDCEDDDTGEYCCVAQNEAGRVTCAGWLTVEVESDKSEEEDESEESEDDDVFVPKEFVEIREDDVQTFYCIEEEVGRGRFGIVKKCVELETATRFCAKFIKSRPSQKEEFKREIAVMNALHHPRLIRLYDAFEEPRQIILIMEFARGGDLFARIDGDSLPEFEAGKILKQVLDGLKFMHDKGFMHLDLKPQNVMFKNEGGSKIKLIDFSLTRKFDPQEETKISFGTAEYVAPEIVNYEPVTLSADMWAIGVIAYIMLSGESPFLGESEADTFSRITEGRWEFSDVFDYVSKEAKDFIKKLLIKDPKQRMTVDECLEHEWIKSPGFTGKQKSSNSTEGESALDENSNVVSPTERKRLESRKSEEQEVPLDAKKLESKLKELVSKLQNAEKENQQLEDKLRDEEERAGALEDELHNSETAKKELEEKVSKLEIEKINLSKKAKENNDVLKRVAETEAQKRALDDKLTEKSKAFETLSQKYTSIKERMDNYDVIEEKVYLLEKERKEYRDTRKHLEEQIENLQTEREELREINDKSTTVNKTLQDEIAELKEDRDKFETQYNSLRDEKESLVQELTKRFEVLDEQRKSLAEEKNNLETKVEGYERKNSDLKRKLETVRLEMDIFKENTGKTDEENDKAEMENELKKIKMQKEEMKKTCEDLASKLSKAYVELEQYKSPANNDETTVNQLQDKVDALQEKLTSLERDRENLEDDLDDKEAEIDELKKTIEQLQTDSKEKEEDLLDYKTKLDAANEEIRALRAKTSENSDEKENSIKHGEDATRSEYEKKLNDYKSMVEKLTKEVSSLQGRLTVAAQRNKELEEKVKSENQASRGHAFLEKEIVVRNENQLECASLTFDDSFSDGKQQQIGNEHEENDQDKNSLLVGGTVEEASESERNIALKKDFEKLKLFTEDLETKLGKEREKIRALEDEVKNFEMEKRRGINMYRELEEEYNRLRDELENNSSSQNQIEVRLREKLRARLKSKEEEIQLLSKQVDSLKKEMQVIKEERDKGNTLYVNLAEKYNNLLKENKILEQEKQERNQRQCKTQELEESLQTRIHEVVQMKEEIESMRDNLRTLVRDKEVGLKVEHTALQKDLVKLTSDREELEKRVRDEMQRADKLERDRSSLQERVDEMQKDLNKRDLVAAADKQTINTYADEIKCLKDEKVHAEKETEKLRKQSKNLLDDLEKLNREKEDAGALKLQKDNALRELEILRRENQQLLQRVVEFDQMKEDFDNFRDGVEKMKRSSEDFTALKTEKENAVKQVEILKDENDTLLQKLDEMDQVRNDLETLEQEKVSGLHEMNTLREEHERKLNEVKAQNEEGMKQIEILKTENERLLQTVDESVKTKKDYDNLRDDLERVIKENEDFRSLNIENKNALKQIEVLRNENNKLLRKVNEMDYMEEELESLREQKVVGLNKMRTLQDENERKMNTLKEHISILKTEKEDAMKQIEILRDENQRLILRVDEFIKMKEDFENVGDLEQTSKEKENSNSLKIENENALKQIEKLENENKQFLEKVEQFDQIKEELDKLKQEKVIALKEMGILRQENDTLLEEIKAMEDIKEELDIIRNDKQSLTEKIQRLKKENETLCKEQEEIQNGNSDFRTFLNENEGVSKENEILRNENETLMSEIEGLKRINEDFSTVRDEEDTLLRKLERLNNENETLLREFKNLNARRDELEKEKAVLANDIKELEGTKEDLRALKDEKERCLIEIDSLKLENKTLLDELETFQGIKEDLNISLEDKKRLEKKGENLEIQLENQALEAMRLKKELTSLKKKIQIITKDLQRLQDEKHRQEEQTSAARKADAEKIEHLSKELKRLQEQKTHKKENVLTKNAANRSEHKTDEVKFLREEISFLEKEVEDLSEDNKQLLQSYNGLQKDYGRFKDEFTVIEKCLENKTNELEKVTEERDLLENRKVELEEELSVISKKLQELKKDYDSQNQKLRHAEKEIEDYTKDNEELHQNYVELEAKYDRIRKLNRELEEDIDIESNNLAEAKTRIEELNRGNGNLRQRITKMQQEISKLRGISEVNSEEQKELSNKVQHSEKNKTIVQSRREQLEARLIEEELRASKFGDGSRKLRNRVESMDEGHKTMLEEKERKIISLEKEVKTLRSSAERANTLEEELQVVKEKLDFEIKNGSSKAEEIQLKKKENDSLIYELESTRHRLVSNVLNPLEETKLPGTFRVSVADISEGKSRAWSCIKESITALIREHERLSTENKTLQEACSRMNQNCEATERELTNESKESPKTLDEITGNHTPARKTPTMDEILSKEKELHSLHQKIVQDEENLALVQNKNKELLRRIEFMKRMQLTGDKDKHKFPAQRSLSSSLDGRLGSKMHSELKLHRLHTVESISIIKHEGDIVEHHSNPIHEALHADLVSDSPEKGQNIEPSQASSLETSITQWPGNEPDGGFKEEEQMEIARELVKKNRRIFELEQEVDVLLKKIEELSCGQITNEKLSSDVERFRQEILRLEGENKSLKELTDDAALSYSQKKIETLEAMNNFLKSEKEELALQISAKNKKIEILERRVNELTDTKTNVLEESKNGVCGDADVHINNLDEELRKTKHRVAELEAELEHFNNSHDSKLKREVDEIEAKWTKRLRKECMELQAELSERHNKEKQQWQKKEVELQNLIRQMKIVMDKKLGQAESERRKLEQQLMTARSSSFHGSTISLDSNSDDSGGSPSPNPSLSNVEIAQTDCLSDRELRRVAYKLNGEEWSQLGTFLGVGDNDLLQLGGLTMGPQEKAFRLLCVWRTRCRLSRSQMISQLAVSLEEVNRKDVAQFVLEQFMSGKPRKKLFGW